MYVSGLRDGVCGSYCREAFGAHLSRGGRARGSVLLLCDSAPQALNVSRCSDVLRRGLQLGRAQQVAGTLAGAGGLLAPRQDTPGMRGESDSGSGP